jgi:hypothetical protein
VGIFASSSEVKETPDGIRIFRATAVNTETMLLATTESSTFLVLTEVLEMLRNVVPEEAKNAGKGFQPMGKNHHSGVEIQEQQLPGQR